MDMFITKKNLASCLSLVLAILLFSSCASSHFTLGNGDKNLSDLEVMIWNTQGSDFIPKSYENNVVDDWLYDKTKVRVKDIYGNDGGQWDVKLTKLVAGNNLPDIVWCQAGQGLSHFIKLNQMGKIWELTPEMIQKHAPNVWERTPGDVWDAISADGKILGIPFNLPIHRLEEVSPWLTEEEIMRIKDLKYVPVNDVMTQSTGDLWIRDDILKMIFPEAKSYGELEALLKERKSPIGEELLDIPIYTTEDYIKFMYDIQNLNLTEGGKKVYSYGYAGDGNDNWEALTILGSAMYGYKGHAYPGKWNYTAKQIEIPLVGELNKQAAKTQNAMINDRVIDPESLAHTGEQYKSKIYNGQYAICTFTRVGNTMLVNSQLKEAGKSYQYRPFVTQVPAQPGYEACESAVAFGDSLCFINSLSEESVIRLLEWIDLQYTAEFEEVMNWGPKSAGLYTETDDGKWQFKDERFTKYFVEGDLTALQPNETMGIRVIGVSFGLLRVTPTLYSKWIPDVYWNYNEFLPSLDSGFKFPVNSPHVTNVKLSPPSQAYLPQYAGIQEVTDFWNARERWEMEFKKAFAAPKDEFEEKWSAAISVLDNIVNIDEMAKKMTEIAKPLAEQIEKGQ
jgi:putative aldouronate transport system substrate-binding protein